MRAFILSTIFALLTVLAQAQAVSLRWSEALKLPAGHTMNEPLGIQDGKLFLQSQKDVFYSGTYPYVTTFDTKTQKLGEFKPLEPEKGKNRLLKTVFNDKGRWVICQKMQNTTRFNLLKVYQIDATGVILLEKQSIVAAFKEAKGTTVFGSNVSVMTSDDSTHTVIVVDAERKSKESQMFYLISLDKTMNILWKQVVELPYPTKRFNVKDIAVMNNGKVAIGGKLYDEQTTKEKNSKNEAAYQYILRLYDGTNAEGIEIKLDMDKKFVVRSQVVRNPISNNLVVMGMYSDKSQASKKEDKISTTQDLELARAGYINGIFHVELNDAGDIVNKYLVPLEIKNIKNWVSNAKEKEKDKELSANYKFQKLLFNKNGDITVVLDNKYYFTTTHSDGKGQSTTSIHYCSGSNIVLRLNAKGKTQWVSAISKSSMMETPDLIGTTIFERNGNIYFVYNDNEWNFAGKPSKTLYEFGASDKAVIVMARMDDKGEVSKQLISTKKDLGGFLFSPMSSRMLGNDEAVFVGAKLSNFGKTQYKIGRMKMVF